MADIRAISLTPPGAPWAGDSGGIVMELETAETGFTVGNAYEVLSLLVDSAPVPPKPYAVCFNDDGYLRIVDLGKLKRASPPV
jgi:hypothetical protein